MEIYRKKSNYCPWAMVERKSFSRNKLRVGGHSPWPARVGRQWREKRKADIRQNPRTPATPWCSQLVGPGSQTPWWGRRESTWVTERGAAKSKTLRKDMSLLSDIQYQQKTKDTAVKSQQNKIDIKKVQKGKAAFSVRQDMWMLIC